MTLKRLDPNLLFYYTKYLASMRGYWWQTQEKGQQTDPKIWASIGANERLTIAFCGNSAVCAKFYNNFFVIKWLCLWRTTVAYAKTNNYYQVVEGVPLVWSAMQDSPWPFSIPSNQLKSFTVSSIALCTSSCAFCQHYTYIVLAFTGLPGSFSSLTVTLISPFLFLLANESTSW